MEEKVKSQFKTWFGHPTIGIKSPGRINIIGEHTDYGKGLVLPTAIDSYTYLFASKSDDTFHCIYSFNFDEEIQIQISNQKLTKSWSKYFEAIFITLRKEGYKISPVNISFGGNIPLGAGMSSSTSLSCGCISLLSALFELNISKEDIALLSQKTEHLVGPKGGLMDQYAILFSKKGFVIKLDCQTLKYNYIPLNLGEFRFAIINSNLPHDLASSSEYNDRRKVGENALNIIRTSFPNIERLLQLSTDHLNFLRLKMSNSDYQKIEFVVNENKRVQLCCEAIINESLTTVGKYLTETHWGLSKKYVVSIREMDELVTIANQNPKVLGARMMGGGFGGSMLLLLHEKDHNSTLSNIAEQYEQKTSIHPQIIIFQFSDGIKRIL